MPELTSHEADLLASCSVQECLKHFATGDFADRAAYYNWTFPILMLALASWPQSAKVLSHVLMDEAAVSLLSPTLLPQPISGVHFDPSFRIIRSFHSTLDTCKTCAQHALLHSISYTTPNTIRSPQLSALSPQPSKPTPICPSRTQKVLPNCAPRQ